MLELIDRPRKTGHGGQIAYFFGHHEDIDTVIAARQSDKSCPQSPKKDDAVSEHYHVRVLYFMTNDGPAVYRIDVRLGQTWNRFFEQDIHEGDFSYCRNRFHCHYLFSTRCVNQVLTKYEEMRAIIRLSQFGPDIFPELEEIDEPDPPHQPEDVE